MVLYAGKEFSREQIRGTLAGLRYYRDFLKSNFQQCIDVESYPDWRFELTRAQARQRLTFLIQVAINRKAGIPDVACRKQDADYQAALRRDCNAIRDRINLRVQFYHLETAELRRRYSNLVSSHEEDE